MVIREVALYLSNLHHHRLETLDQAWLGSYELQRISDFSTMLEHLFRHAGDLQMELFVLSMEQVKTITIYHFFSAFNHNSKNINQIIPLKNQIDCSFNELF